MALLPQILVRHIDIGRDGFPDEFNWVALQNVFDRKQVTSIHPDIFG